MRVESLCDVVLRCHLYWLFIYWLFIFFIGLKLYDLCGVTFLGFHYNLYVTWYSLTCSDVTFYNIDYK